MSQGTEKRREELINRIANSLETGIVPWQRLGLPLSPPTNAVTGRSYKGVNALYLIDSCGSNITNGNGDGAGKYQDNRWVTANDAKKHGFLIKEGEHGTVIEHWSENKDGKMTVKGYPIFNVAQLNAYIPPPETKLRPDLSRAYAMLHRVGIDMNEDEKLPDYLENIRKYVSLSAKNQFQNVHTDDLKTLRVSMATAMVCQEMNIDNGMAMDSPTKSWAESIRHNPRELFNAARDASKLADTILKDMEYERNPVQRMDSIKWDVIREEIQKAQSRQEAQQEKAEASRAEGIIEDAALIPDGLDSNLPNADLNAEQEAVKSSVDKASAEVKNMRSAATQKETAASQSPTASATAIAKEKMGRGAIVTNAQTGKAYSGKIIGVTGNHPDRIAIQRITGNQAVLHRIKDISSEANLSIGADVTITKGQDGKTKIITREEADKVKENERNGRGL
jgi:antirestriction protein ArdC